MVMSNMSKARIIIIFLSFINSPILINEPSMAITITIPIMMTTHLPDHVIPLLVHLKL